MGHARRRLVGDASYSAAVADGDWLEFGIACVPAAPFGRARQPEDGLRRRLTPGAGPRDGAADAPWVGASVASLTAGSIEQIDDLAAGLAHLVDTFGEATGDRGAADKVAFCNSRIWQVIQKKQSGSPLP